MCVIEHRALYNRRNSLHYTIPPILGAFYSNDNRILFTDLKQVIVKKCPSRIICIRQKIYSLLTNASEMGG